MRRTKILDNDPNSIFSASRKLATIANHNMKNPIQNDAIQQGLNSLLVPSSLNNQLNNSLLPKNNNNILINKLPLSQPIKADVNVDEFISMISETNNSIEALHILINNYDEDSKVDEDDGGVLYRPNPNQRRLQGGMVNDDNNEDDVIGAEEGKSGDEYKSNNTPDTKFGMDDIYNTKMSPEPSSNEQRQTQIQKEIDELNETIHNENKNLEASQMFVTTYESHIKPNLRKYIGKNIDQKSFFTDYKAYKKASEEYDQRKSTPTVIKPKSYKIVKEFEDTYGDPPFVGTLTKEMFKEYKRYMKNLESIDRAKSVIKEAEKDIQLLEVKLKNIDVEYKFDDSEKSRRTLQNQFELEQKENQNAQQQIQEHINELNAVLRDKEIAQYERTEVENELRTLKEEKEQLTIERQSLRDDYESMEEKFRDRHREHEEEIDKLNATTIEQTTKRKQAENLLNYSKNTNPVIDLITRTNSKMNQLFIFFKGKIKPNLKSISKSDIQNMITDMQQLYDNHVEVYNEIIDKYNSIFTINGKTVSKKTDAFIDTFSKSFDKSYNEIINNLQSYSSIGNYSTSSVPNGILFNSKVPTFNGKGLQLVPDVVRRNMHHNHKYLL